MHCTSLHCWELLRPFAQYCQQHPTSAGPKTPMGVVASVCTVLPTTSNICRTNNSYGSCCVRLHSTANNIQHLPDQKLPWELLRPFAQYCQQHPTSAGPITPMGVVASVCTVLPTTSNICRTNNSYGSCCVRLHSTANNIQHLPDQKLPWELLRPFAQYCRKTSNICRTKNSHGSCCVRLHSTANNIHHLPDQKLPWEFLHPFAQYGQQHPTSAGPKTPMGVVASVCTVLPTTSTICRTKNTYGRCCVRLHSIADNIQHLPDQKLPWELLHPFAQYCQQHPTSAGPKTPMGIVASVCTVLPTTSNICRTKNSQQCWYLGGFRANFGATSTS